MRFWSFSNAKLQCVATRYFQQIKKWSLWLALQSTVLAFFGCWPGVYWGCLVMFYLTTWEYHILLSLQEDGVVIGCCCVDSAEVRWRGVGRKSVGQNTLLAVRWILCIFLFFSLIFFNGLLNLLRVLITCLGWRLASVSVLTKISARLETHRSRQLSSNR